MKLIAVLALLASVNAVKFIEFDPSDDNVDLQIGVEASARATVRQQLQQQLRSFLNSQQEERRLIDDAFLFLQDEDDTVEGARRKAAEMQAQLDKAVADADAKRAEQQRQYDNQDMSDPASQLQGLMNAQASLHRLTANFSSKPNVDKVTEMAKKLGIPMTPELMQLGNNEAISNALVEIAVGMGKSEAEISNALGAE